jgi:tetratricopeptide (TPR) repeat protein
LQPVLSDTARTQDINQFANQCRRFYAHNNVMLAQIDAFLSPPNGYSSNRAAQYYTRDTFFFKRVNKALRQQNFQAILDFRFFLLDMQAQLQTAYSEFAHLYDIGNTMVFYRGQRMSKQEMDLLKEKRQTGSLVTVNSYLSTSIKRDIAMKFIVGSSSDELLPVIFEISAEFKNPNVIRRKPFAFIGHLSYYHAAELEVLFSVGSFFRVTEIKFNEENIHIIQLTFIYDEDHYTITDDYGTLRTCSLEEKLVKTADLLSNHVKHGAIKANAFYQRFLSDNYSLQITAACHAGLGWLAFKQKQFDLAIQRQQQALEKYEVFNDENSLNYLYVTSYNCLGAVYQQQKQYTKALSYYYKAYKTQSNTDPIDKYAFYNLFSNVASVNIACIYKIQGDITGAWSTFKKILASQMNKSTLFHGPIYLKIAEAGSSEGMWRNDNDEQMEYVNNWKSFLDFSLTDMSSDYRRSIVSGALSIGLRFANHERTRDKAIDYYKKIVQISHKYINVSSDDYYIVVQCHRQIAELYRKKGNFTMAITYASDGLKLCRVTDLESITAFYENMSITYEQQLQPSSSNSSPEDIDSKILLDRLISPSLADVQFRYFRCQPIVLNFERNEFSFGQYKKALNSNLSKETNVKRCLAYCRLKIAALKEEQGQTDTIRELLNGVPTLIADNVQIQFICDNNLAYLDGDFDRIINIYERSLEERYNDDRTVCVDEDAFCYIAYLYGRKNNTDAERQWYTKAITYFKEHQFVCEHTQLCFVKMASFYQTNNDLSSCLSTYLDLAHHLRKYRDGISQLQREIVTIVEDILQLDTKNEEKIFILKRLIKLIMQQSEDITSINADFQWIINRYKKNMEHSAIVTQAYESYLDSILKHTASTLTPYVQTIIPAIRQAITIYKPCDDHAAAFDVYQRLTDIILIHSTNRDHIIATFKRIGLDLEQKRKRAAVLDIYEGLRQFIFVHRSRIILQDDELIYYILTRHQMLIDRDKEPAAPIYRIMISILRSYREDFNPDFELKKYLQLLKKYYMELAVVEPLTALDSYYNLLDIFLCLCPYNFDELLAEIVDVMKDRPAELLELLTKYRFNYIQLIRQVYRRLSHPNDRSIMRKPFIQTQSSCINDMMSSFANKVKRYLGTSNSEQTIIQCWTKCIYFLLEDCSKSDEYFATCYVKLNNPIRAANVFDSIVYCNLALKYCPNACRRYLKYIYPRTQMQGKLQVHFVDHFYLVNDKKEIRALEPIEY